MKKSYIFIVCLFCMSLGYAQIGINTPLPVQMFHVDAKKNNIGNMPSTDQMKDDFVITSEGNVGIGTINPTAKLDVRGQMHIADGTEGADKLYMSDKDGIGRWEPINYMIPPVLGESPSMAKVIFIGPLDAAGLSHANRTWLSSTYSIKLPKGKWVVNSGLTLNISGFNQTTKTSDWIHTVLSTDPTKPAQVGFRFEDSRAGNNTSFAARLLPGFGLIRGGNVIVVTEQMITLFLIVEKNSKWEIDPASGMNYLYALPIL